MPVTIGLVGCGARKRAGCHPARDLYTGPLFRCALAASLELHDATYILSALYGLVPLDRRVQSYDLSLARRPPDERSLWAGGVLIRLARLYPDRGTMKFVIFAGALYVQPLLAAARIDPAWTFETPLASLPLFERLRWLRAAARAVRRASARTTVIC